MENAAKHEQEDGSQQPLVTASQGRVVAADVLEGIRPWRVQSSPLPDDGRHCRPTSFVEEVQAENLDQCLRSLKKDATDTTEQTTAATGLSKIGGQNVRRVRRKQAFSDTTEWLPGEYDRTSG